MLGGLRTLRPALKSESVSWRCTSGMGPDLSCEAGSRRAGSMTTPDPKSDRVWRSRESSCPSQYWVSGIYTTFFLLPSSVACVEGAGRGIHLRTSTERHSPLALPGKKPSSVSSFWPHIIKWAKLFSNIFCHYALPHFCPLQDSIRL